MAAVARSQAGRLSIGNEEQKEALTEQIMNAILDDDDERLEELVSEEEKERPVYNNDEEYTGSIAQAWIRLTNPVYEIAYGNLSGYFDAVIFTVIIFAGVMVGVQTYPKFNCNAPSKQDDVWAKNLEADFVDSCRANQDLEMDILAGGGVIDTFIKWTFVAEFVIKLLANGAAPWRYFYGHAEWKWNLFDFMLVLLSFDSLARMLLPESLSANVMVLRLFRLARLFKLVGKVPKLQQIMIGLVAGIKATVYIALLLLLVFYIFAIMGMLFFLPNDPFHFRNIGVSMMSLFRAATLEDWTDIMYINIYGCDKFSSGLYYVKSAYIDEATRQPIPGAFDGHPYYSSWQDVPNYYRCNDFDDEKDTRGTTLGLGAVAAAYWIGFTFISAFIMLSLFVGAVTLAMSESMNPDEDKVDDPTGFASALVVKRNHLKNNSFEFKRRLVQAWNAYAAASNDPATIEEEPAPTETTFKIPFYSNYIAAPAKYLSETTPFVFGVTLTILIAGVLIGVDQEVKGDASIDDGASTVNVVLYYMDWIVNLIFTAEVLLKLLGEDWHPWRYFIGPEWGWNNFDFIIVAGSWLPYILKAMGGEGGEFGVLKLLRLLRLFRVLRVIKFLPDLAVIVESLLAGLESIGWIGLILFTVFYLFAIVGMMLFQDNDPFHFGNLHLALLSLFRVSTFEDWTDVMYINIYSCSGWGYTDDDTVPLVSDCDNSHPPNAVGAVFFVVFVFLAALILLTLFIGVITTAMDEAQEAQKAKKGCLGKMKAWAKGFNIPDKCIPTFEKAFYDIDLDSSGDIDIKELRVAMKFTELMAYEGGVEHLMKDIDVDGNGTVDLYEFGMFIMNQLAMLAGSTKRFHHERDGHKNRSDDGSNVKRAAKTKSKGGGGDAFYIVPASPGAEKVAWARDGKLKMAKKYRQLKQTDKVALEAVREMATAGKKDVKKTDAEITFFASMIGQELIETCTESKAGKNKKAVMKFLLEVVHTWMAKDKAQGSGDGNGTEKRRGSGKGRERGNGNGHGHGQNDITQLPAIDEKRARRGHSHDPSPNRTLRDVEMNFETTAPEEDGLRSGSTAAGRAGLGMAPGNRKSRSRTSASPFAANFQRSKEDVSFVDEGEGGVDDRTTSLPRLPSEDEHGQRI